MALLYHKTNILSIALRHNKWHFLYKKCYICKVLCGRRIIIWVFLLINDDIIAILVFFKGCNQAPQPSRRGGTPDYGASEWIKKSSNHVRGFFVQTFCITERRSVSLPLNSRRIAGRRAWLSGCGLRLGSRTAANWRPCNR